MYPEYLEAATEDEGYNEEEDSHSSSDSDEIEETTVILE